MDGLLDAFKPADWINIGVLIVTALVSTGTLIAALAARRTAEIAAEEFRMTRTPAIAVPSWEVYFAQTKGHSSSETALCVAGTVRDIVNLPTWIRQIHTRAVRPIGGSLLSDTAKLEENNLLSGAEFTHDLRIDFDPGPVSSSSGAIALVYVWITFSAVRGLDQTVFYRLLVRWEETRGHPEVSIMDTEFVTGPGSYDAVERERPELVLLPLSPGERRQWKNSGLTEALRRAWKGGRHH